MEFQNPQYLVETDWLEENLDDANLRILDCTVYLPNYFDASAAEKVEIVSGREHWEQGHIPGSASADLVPDLCDPQNTDFMFPMPAAEQFAEAMSRQGVGEGTHVVLYDDMLNIWATRVWWMLRAFRFRQRCRAEWGLEEMDARGTSDINGGTELSSGSVRRSAAPGADCHKGGGTGGHRQSCDLYHQCS